jgi:hypothetical protein
MRTPYHAISEGTANAKKTSIAETVPRVISAHRTVGVNPSTILTSTLARCESSDKYVKAMYNARAENIYTTPIMGTNCRGDNVYGSKNKRQPQRTIKLASKLMNNFFI